MSDEPNGPSVTDGTARRLEPTIPRHSGSRASAVDFDIASAGFRGIGKTFNEALYRQRDVVLRRAIRRFRLRVQGADGRARARHGLLRRALARLEGRVAGRPGHHVGRSRAPVGDVPGVSFRPGRHQRAVAGRRRQRRPGHGLRRHVPHRRRPRGSRPRSSKPAACSARRPLPGLRPVPPRRIVPGLPPGQPDPRGVRRRALRAGLEIVGRLPIFVTMHPALDVPSRLAAAPCGAMVVRARGEAAREPTAGTADRERLFWIDRILTKPFRGGPSTELLLARKR